MTPGGIERVARIADGLNPIAISRDQLEAQVTAYAEASQAVDRGSFYAARLGVVSTPRTSWLS